MGSVSLSAIVMGAILLIIIAIAVALGRSRA